MSIQLSPAASLRKTPHAIWEIAACEDSSRIQGTGQAGNRPWHSGSWAANSHPRPRCRKHRRPTFPPRTGWCHAGRSPCYAGKVHQGRVATDRALDGSKVLSPRSRCPRNRQTEKARPAVHRRTSLLVRSPRLIRSPRQVRCAKAGRQSGPNRRRTEPALARKTRRHQGRR